MKKFKIGDTVRCVSRDRAKRTAARGYEPGREFIVNRVSNSGTYGYVYFSTYEYGVFECDLELVKTLPKSFACTNTNQKLWDKYIKWLDVGFEGDVSTYYGIHIDGFKTSGNIKRSYDTILSLEEWDEIVNGTKIKIKEEVMKTIEITRDRLKEIWDVACTDWKETIVKYANRNPFGNTINFTQKEVDTMFKAATLDQTPVLEGIFGKQSKDIDLSTGMVDGLELFRNHDDPSHSTKFSTKFLIAIRSSGHLCGKSFYLNEDFNWEIVTDNQGIKCLVPTRK
jgi:hypothetical protein